MSIEFSELSCKEYAKLLSSKESVPGGGSGSALVAALGISLGMMAGNLTLHKSNKNNEIENPDDMVLHHLGKAQKILDRLMSLVQEDSEAFMVLSDAYSLPKDYKNRDKILKDALIVATRCPLNIMKCCCEAIDIQSDFEVVGFKHAISDVGVGISFLRSALLGASLNVFINTKVLRTKDEELANRFDTEAYAMIDEYTKKSDEIFDKVYNRVK